MGGEGVVLYLARRMGNIRNRTSQLWLSCDGNRGRGRGGVEV